MAISETELAIILRGIDETSPAFAKVQANVQELNATTVEAAAGTTQMAGAEKVAATEAKGLTEQVNAARGEVKSFIRDIAIVTAALALLKKGEEEVAASAERMGQTETKKQFDELSVSANRLKDLFLTMPNPFTGFQSAIQFNTDLAAVVNAVSGAVEVQKLKIKELRGEISAAEYATASLAALTNREAEAHERVSKAIKDQSSDLAALAQIAGMSANNLRELTDSQEAYLRLRAASTGSAYGRGQAQTPPGGWGN